MIVAPVGDLDIGTGSALEEVVAELRDQGFGNVVIDLRQVTFIDSTGIRALVCSTADGRSAGTRVSVVLGDAMVMKPLHMTHVVERLDVVPR